jgi:Leucine-rich repeat (LRR) protein
MPIQHVGDINDQTIEIDAIKSAENYPDNLATYYERWIEAPNDKDQRKERKSFIDDWMIVSIKSNTPHFLFIDSKIDELPPNMGLFLSHITKLSSFHLSKLKLGNITHLTKEMFNGMTKLESISFENHPIETIDENTFDDLPELNHIKISYGKIENLPPDMFKSNPQLRLVSFSHNNITQLPNRLFDHCKKLTDISLHNNCITKLAPPIFNHCEKLERITVNCNELTIIPHGLFHPEAPLTSGHFENNKITDVNIETAEQFKERIYLEKNPLSNEMEIKIRESSQKNNAPQYVVSFDMTISDLNGVTLPENFKRDHNVINYYNNNTIKQKMLVQLNPTDSDMSNTNAFFINSFVYDTTSLKTIDKPFLKKIIDKNAILLIKDNHSTFYTIDDLKNHLNYNNLRDVGHQHPIENCKFRILSKEETEKLLKKHINQP